MKMGQATRDAWLSLITVKRNTLTKLCGRPAAIKNEDEFRIAFEILCDVYNQPRAQPLLRGLFRLFRRIAVFSRSIDGAGIIDLADSLTSLFWSYAYALIKTAFQRRVQLTDLVTTLQSYTKKVPKFGTDLLQHFSVASVQAPLQRFYSEYIDCYVMMITRLTTSPTSTFLESIKRSLNTLVAEFTKAKTEWRVAFSAVKRASWSSVQKLFTRRCWTPGNLDNIVSRMSVLCVQAMSTSGAYDDVNHVKIEVYPSIAILIVKVVLSHILRIIVAFTDVSPKMSRGKYRKPDF